MGNRVYYGEYSLEYWIQLMLNERIVLPEYQRVYRWDQNDIENLNKAFLEDSFVPPVTIGHYIDSTGKKNDLILDGQQRLTSILLSYLKVFPLKTRENIRIVNEYYDSEDQPTQDEIDEFYSKFKEWRYTSLLNYGSTKNDIRVKALRDRYQELDLQYKIDEEKLKDIYLGFSYIVPKISSENSMDAERQQTKYYATVFQSINSTGISLGAQESRAAMYYLDRTIQEFFQPAFASEILVSKSGRQMDFVRALSFVSEFATVKNSANGFRKVAVGVARGNFENYYLKFIVDSIKEHMDTRAPGSSGDLQVEVQNHREYKFISHNSDFWESEWQIRYEIFFNILKEIKPGLQFDSIIELDIITFGLIYYTIIENHSITPDMVGCIQQNIAKCLEEIDSNYNHKRNPNRITYIRYRLEKSINIYKDQIGES